MSNYVADVADLLLSHCPEMTFLGAADYTIIAEWEKEEIPIAVVLDSIKEICESLNGEHANIASISHFHSPVKIKLINWLQTHTE